MTEVARTRPGDRPELAGEVELVGVVGTAPVRCDPQVTGGTPFLRAVHALLEVGPTARIEVPGVETMLVLDPEPRVLRWPSGLDLLGPDDGTATCALLAGCREVL